MNELPPPFVLSLVAADDVFIDPATSKPTARGIFFSIDLPLPVRLDFAILVTLTEVRRMEAIGVAVLDPDDHPIHRATWYVAGDDALRIHSNVTRCSGVQFARPGTYRVQVACDGMTLAEQPIAVGSYASPLLAPSLAEWARRPRS